MKTRSGVVEKGRRRKRAVFLSEETEAAEGEGAALAVVGESGGRVGVGWVGEDGETARDGLREGWEVRTELWGEVREPGEAGCEGGCEGGVSVCVRRERCGREDRATYLC